MNKCLIFILFIIPQSLSEQAPQLFIIWDVGQGLWSTLVLQKMCVHFDMGGEYFRHNSNLTKHCAHKDNRVVLSHLDSDHVRFLQKIHRRFNICIINRHQFPKHKSIKSIASCHQPQYLQQLYISKFNYKNESHIYKWKNRILASGDAYKKQERQIKKKDLLDIEFLIVSHHGSRTSSEKKFISSFKNLKQALVSARKEKYGHPHKLTLSTFKKNHIPLIETDLYGTLIYEY